MISYEWAIAMTDFLNTLTPYVAVLFLVVSGLLVWKKERYPLIMRLWFYHATMYWAVNSLIVIMYGHYLNPQIINMWATAIAIQAGTSVVGTIYAREKWKVEVKPDEV